MPQRTGAPSLNMNPSLLSLLKHPIHLCAFGFGSGLINPAPGTWGTLLGTLIILPFLSLLSAPLIAIAFLVLTFAFGVYCCERTSQDIGIHDFGGIVWDEFVGVWLVLLFIPPALIDKIGLWWSCALAFVLFRLFDISKPPPIKQLDQQLTGGLGIMLDDIIAGAFALACLWLITLLTI